MKVLWPFGVADAAHVETLARALAGPEVSRESMPHPSPADK
jgi:hypothetical protein